MTASGYAAEAAVSAAEGQAPPLGHALRLALTHLLLARNEVRRASTAILDALAAAPDAQRPWVDDAGETATRAIRRVDDAAAAVVDGLSRVLR